MRSGPCMHKLQPGHSQEIPVTFKPTVAQEYFTAMPIRVNGLYNININLAGELKMLWQGVVDGGLILYLSTCSHRICTCQLYFGCPAML